MLCFYLTWHLVIFTLMNQFSSANLNQIDVTLQLTSGLITSASVKALSQQHTSLRYQQDFIQNYKDQVVGKKIADLNLNTVSGASLTTDGFNSALNTIKNEANTL